MSLIDWSMGEANNGQVRLFFTYDDQTNVIQSVTLDNIGDRGTITLSLLNPNTRAVIFGPETRNAKTGTITRDVSNLNIHMQNQTGRGGTVGLAPPFAWAWIFTSA